MLNRQDATTPGRQSEEFEPQRAQRSQSNLLKSQYCDFNPHLASLPISLRPLRPLRFNFFFLASWGPAVENKNAGVQDAGVSVQLVARLTCSAGSTRWGTGPGRRSASPHR